MQHSAMEYDTKRAPRAASRWAVDITYVCGQAQFQTLAWVCVERLKYAIQLARTSR